MQPLFDTKALNNVEYLGLKTPEELREEIQKATICVFPSFVEAFPLSWLEAMAMEKAVVASNVGWGIELVNHRVDGFLSDPKDHNQFAQYINVLLKDPNLNRKMGKNARKSVVEKFGHQMIAIESIKFYKSIMPNARL
jgi:glycosyltransferase involved in cell wall biosynthesis